MNKKLMAVAVAGALAVPGVALAQSSTVNIGGSLTTFYYQHNPRNPLVGQKGDILEPSEPELYFHGEEKLGGGLTAWFRCTSQMDGFIGGTATGNAWCTRNSGVGFKGGFGNVFQGNWDTPNKLVMNQARKWFGSTNAFTGGSGRFFYGNGPSGVSNPAQSTVGVLSATIVPTLTVTSTNVPGGFARRQSNSWNYHSPSWGGFSVQGAYSADNESTGRPETSLLEPRLYSLAGNYSNGPLYVGASYEKHRDYNPGNHGGTGTIAGTAYSGGKDINLTLVGGFKFGGFDLRALISRTDYDVHDGAELRAKGWGLYADWNIAGPHTLRAQFLKMNDISGNSTLNVAPYIGPGRLPSCGPTSTASCASDTGAKLWSIFYSYAFSKRTEGSVGFTKLDNDSNAAYSYGKVGAVAGNSQTGAGIVLKHRF